MRIFYTGDKKFYRRWINILPSILLPGSAQFLSGRRKTGLIWLAAYFSALLLVLGIELWPSTPFALGKDSSLEILPFAVYVAAMLDGFRKAIPVLGFRKGFLFLAGILALLLGPGFIVRTFLFQSFPMPTNSMAPTLNGDSKTGEENISDVDQFIVDKWTYRFRDPQRGELAVYEHEEKIGPPRTSIYLKRIVGLPGERVELRPPFLLINDKVVSEPSIFKKMGERIDGFGGYRYLPGSIYLRGAGDSYLLKEDEYFVLGDNSSVNSDSRRHGPVKRSAIFGKAVYIRSPAARKGFLQ